MKFKDTKEVKKGVTVDRLTELRSKMHSDLSKEDQEELKALEEKENG